MTNSIEPWTKSESNLDQRSALRARRAGLAAVLTVWVSAGGCWNAPATQLVIYSALDQEFSQPLIDQFQRQSEIAVAGKFDVESTKTVGLTNAIIAESRHPRCDVFWNNEILNTLRLQKRGLLAPYDSAAGAKFPAEFRDPQGHWYGLAARARVFLVNTDLLTKSEWPSSTSDLTDPKWRNRVALAKPLFGTTATHATVLFHLYGADEAQSFFTRVARNAQILSGNRQVALAVASGQVAWGLTDTDDAMIEIEKGRPVTIVYPDQAPDELGTLFIPNTVAILRGCPHPAAARQFIEYVLSPDVEQALAAGPSAQIPLNPMVTSSVRVATPSTVRALQVDFGAVVDSWEAAAPVLREIFMRAGGA